MRGYVTDAGYMGMVNGKYMLFSSEEDYSCLLYTSPSPRD